MPDMASLASGMQVPTGGNYPAEPAPTSEPAPPAPFKRVVSSGGRKAPMCGLKRRGAGYIPSPRPNTRTSASPTTTAVAAVATTTTTTGGDAAAPASTPLTRTQRSSVKGYQDGFLTAKIFGLYGMSKLGFTGQYLQDSVVALGDAIPEGTEGVYRTAFMQGLGDGEVVVAGGVQD